MVAPGGFFLWTDGAMHPKDEKVRCDRTSRRGIAPGLRTSQDGLADRVRRGVITAFGDDGLRVCGCISVHCDFDRC